jgi:hypothetical protein
MEGTPRTAPPGRPHWLFVFAIPEEKIFHTVGGL